MFSFFPVLIVEPVGSCAESLYDGLYVRLTPTDLITYLKYLLRFAGMTQGCSGAGTRGGQRPPTFFGRGDASPTPPTFLD